jgi:hypothetical protein
MPASGQAKNIPMPTAFAQQENATIVCQMF